MQDCEGCLRESKGSNIKKIFKGTFAHIMRALDIYVSGIMLFLLFGVDGLGYMCWKYWTFMIVVSTCSAISTKYNFRNR